MTKMLTVFLYCLCTFFVVVSCQDCSDDFDKFYRCIDQSKEVKNEGSSYKKENEKKNKISKCFASQNCQEPKFDNRPQPVFRFKDAVEEKADEDRKKRAECRQLIHRKVRESIEMCVQEKIPGFHLHNKTHALWKPTFTMKKMKDQVEHNCNDPNARPVVIQCLDDLHMKHDEKTTKEEYDKKIRQNCQWREKCIPLMSQKCQLLHDSAKPIVCDCARQRSKSDSESLAKQFDDCVGSAKLTLDDKPPMTSTLIGNDFERMCDEISCLKKDIPTRKPKGDPNGEPKGESNVEPKKEPNGELPHRKNVKNN